MKLTGFYIKTNVICTIPLLKKPGLITYHLCSKTAQIQNLCGVQSTKFAIALAHPHYILQPLLLLINLVLFFVEKIKALRSKLPLIDLNPFTIPDRLPHTFSLCQPASVEDI